MYLVIQLFFIAGFSNTIFSIYNAFGLKIKQLITLFFMLFIVITFLSTFAFFFYIQEFNIIEDNISNSISNTNVCQSLTACIFFFFNYGIRSGGGVGDTLPVLYINNNLFWIRFIMDAIFYIIVILLFLNMINGIIISGFTEYREKLEEKIDTQKNRCLICNLHRNEFDIKKLSFEDHVLFDHCLYNYFFYYDYLKKQSNLNDEEKQFLISIDNLEITIFPNNNCRQFNEN